MELTLHDINVITIMIDLALVATLIAFLIASYIDSEFDLSISRKGELTIGIIALTNVAVFGYNLFIA